MKKLMAATFLALVVVLLATTVVAGDSDADNGEPYFTDSTTTFRYKIVDGSDYGILNAVELVNPGSSGNTNVPDSTYVGTPVVPATVEYNGTTYNVIGISDRAFLHSSITGITLNEGLKYIDGSAFADSNLTSIVIPASVERIGTSVAYASSTANSPVFASSGEKCSLASLAFTEDSKLNYIGPGALEGIAVQNLIIPAGVTDLGLVYEMNYSGPVAALQALDGWDHASDVQFAQGSQFANVNGVLYKNDSLHYCLNENIDALNVREGTTSIGSYSLMYCSVLNTVNIPGSVKTIGDCAFYGCSAISALNLSEGLTGIGDDAFNYVPGLVPTYRFENGSLVLKGDNPANILNSVVIPSTVTNIGDNFLQGALKSDGTSMVVFLGKTAPQMGSNAFATSYNTENSDFNHELNLYYSIGSEDSYKTAMGDCYNPSNGYFLTVEYSKVSASAGGTVEIGIESGPRSFTLLATPSDSSVKSIVEDGKIKIVGNNEGEYTVTVYLMLGQTALTETTIDVTVKEPNDDTTTTETTTTITNEDGQEIITTVTTVTDNATNESSTTTTISTSTKDEITTEASVSNDTVTVTVTAGSETPLDNVIEQAELISKIVIDDGSLPSSISKTEIVIENDAAGASVTLTLDIVESLSTESQDMSVSIVVGHFDEDSMTSAQISALENGKAFELSAILADNEGAAVDRIHDLGGSVTVFLPFMVSGGMDVEDYGVYYIDIYGNTTDMGSSYDASRGGFVFETDHFSLFAVMEVPAEDPIIPPFYPGWDDDDIPYIPPTVVDDSDSDEPIKVVACAAAAVAAAIMMMFLIVDSRKR
ncbi:leucine-rich repeat domain-containing protein [Candidatus Methanoprimaticola sp. MG2]|uniref:leucine-rich repeat domain-containing protein n=1 Tax=Candidatus Methanoprimaticola sp. MG2 TaxID=3228838 RepID=UPI0039C67ECF